MAILKVAQLGHPVLREDAEDVLPGEIVEPGFQDFLDDMIDTMREYDGVGLAAPQVHVSKKIVSIEVRSDSDSEAEEGLDIPLMVLINPEIIFFPEERVSGWEGCLSLGTLRGLVGRSKNVKVKALDREGKGITLEPDGFLNIILQHEIDHLHSTLFVDRMENLKSLSFLPEFNRYAQG